MTDRPAEQDDEHVQDGETAGDGESPHAEEQHTEEQHTEEQHVHVPGVRELPLVALRETVIFPEMIVPLQVGRDKSVAALNAATAASGPIALVTQREAEREEIEDPSELYSVGTLAKIAQVVQLQDGTVRAMIRRFQMTDRPADKDDEQQVTTTAVDDAQIGKPSDRHRPEVDARTSTCRASGSCRSSPCARRSSSPR